MSPIKKVHYHDIHDSTECHSCGAEHGIPVYRNRENPLLWEFCAEPCGLKRHPRADSFPQRPGWSREKTQIILGFCKACSKLEPEVRFRGVDCWQAVRLVKHQDGTYSTSKIPHDTPRGRMGHDHGGGAEEEDDAE